MFCLPVAAIDGEAELVAHFGLTVLDHDAAQRQLAVHFELQLRSRRSVRVEQHVRELAPTKKNKKTKTKPKRLRRRSRRRRGRGRRTRKNMRCWKPLRDNFWRQPSRRNCRCGWTTVSVPTRSRCSSTSFTKFSVACRWCPMAATAGSSCERATAQSPASEWPGSYCPK